MLKEDLAGGRMPSGKFGANAAWWAIAVLAFNLNSAMKWLVLGGQWVSSFDYVYLSIWSMNILAPLVMNCR